MRVLGSTSEKTGIHPAAKTARAGKIGVVAGHITSSPGLGPRPATAASLADVPEFRA
jgi:hypothetical protein